MIRWPVVLVLVYVAAVLETSLGDLLDVGGASPDWLALVAVATVLTLNDRYAFVAAAAIGLISDLLAAGPVGPGVASFAVVGYSVWQWRAKFHFTHPAHHVAVAWVAVTLSSLAITAAAWSSGSATAPLATLALRALGVGVYTAGVSVPVFMLLGWTGAARTKRAATQAA